MNRHLTLTLLACIGCCVLFASTALADDGFVPIFDGETLDGWDGNPEIWSVEDGAITGRTSAEKPLTSNTFCIWRDGEVGDFVLRLDMKMEGGNSGIQYRSFEKPDEWGQWVIGGYQADFESGDNFSGILYGEKFRGILARRGQRTVIGDDHKPTVVEQFADAADLQQYINKDGWNSYEIRAQGFTFTHIINGHVMCEVTDEDEAERLSSGLVALQCHVGPPMKVQFRNIRLRTLEPGEAIEEEAVEESDDDAKKIVFIAGRKSHGYMGHEHNAGCILLAEAINENMPGVECSVVSNGYPEDASVLEDADCIVVFCDGGGGHPYMPHWEEIDALAEQGVGIVCLHYGVEAPKGDPGNYLLKWTGGYFETEWSVNPHFIGEFTEFVDHPVTEGVQPFAVDDEWYYHMRFPEDMENVTPVLTCIPPNVTRERPDGAHSNNPTVRERRGMPEHVGWVIERPDGGRGFGFTGGHWHWNWAQDDFRKIVLNGVCWSAGINIPKGGIETPTPDFEQLLENQDYEPWPEDRMERIHADLDKWASAKDE